MTPNKKEMSYNEAINELEKLIVDMEENDLDIDTLSAKIEKSAKIIELCRSKLFKTEQEVQQIIDTMSGN